jgi:hypothetical protein
VRSNMRRTSQDFLPDLEMLSESYAAFRKATSAVQIAESRLFPEWFCETLFLELSHAHSDFSASLKWVGERFGDRIARGLVAGLAATPPSSPSKV